MISEGIFLHEGLLAALGTHTVGKVPQPKPVQYQESSYILVQIMIRVPLSISPLFWNSDFYNR